MMLMCNECGHPCEVMLRHTGPEPLDFETQSQCCGVGVTREAVDDTVDRLINVLSLIRFYATPNSHIYYLAKQAIP